MSCYFDDFVIFSPPGLANNSQSALSLMLDIFGWAFDREGPKSDNFSGKVSALGVVFNLDPTSDGCLEVHNTERRLYKGSCRFLDSIILAGRLGKKHALSLRGRLAFCDAFIFGRLGRVSLQNISHHAYASPFTAELSVEMIHSLKILRGRMAGAKLRCLDLNLLNTFVFMTDAAFDPGKGAAGLGAVLVDPSSAVTCWFGIHLTMSAIDRLMTKANRQSLGNLRRWQLRLHLCCGVAILLPPSCLSSLTMRALVFHLSRDIPRRLLSHISVHLLRMRWIAFALCRGTAEYLRYRTLLICRREVLITFYFLRVCGLLTKA